MEDDTEMRHRDTLLGTGFILMFSRNRAVPLLRILVCLDTKDSFPGGEAAGA
jgi:hypothetical protein